MDIKKQAETGALAREIYEAAGRSVIAAIGRGTHDLEQATMAVMHAMATMLLFNVCPAVQAEHRDKYRALLMPMFQDMLQKVNESADALEKDDGPPAVLH